MGSKGMLFFTFSAADTHWPDLHDLMPNGENPAVEVCSESGQSGYLVIHPKFDQIRIDPDDSSD
ncbi:hypothetical protein RirG_067920 [Rhizophagus irregularis DAOM 197198w]|uniref:Uncharacterized protein n=1 Tax=Rhizophagus irregularis (strain DAOM 197198w) TaxID=1432141 RepID=A0A015JZ13_RHIIW|nr:hypothetical protein RirG_254970 [Rhizophagus irregularis DAOM 197198w]EXX72588.1 hypothetical protein RirG_067900 [Rhizophagus irregularis DAOM 197198w]EXX72589.1 hypothetical protein RirG_067910 [Rhizophagus irregularis DAOM 197198w]EXX72590.1 hypothetical protein RirG_067920 [Rhizophagus irregularis DAOM 197198w]